MEVEIKAGVLRGASLLMMPKKHSTKVVQKEARPLVCEKGMT